MSWRLAMALICLTPCLAHSDAVTMMGYGAGPPPISFDAQADEVDGGTAADPTWSHTSGGSPEAVLIFCATTGSTDIYTGATYDGESLTQVASCSDTTTEPVFGELYFLGTSVNTTATVNAVCTTTDTTTTKWGWSITLNAARDTQNGGTCNTTAELAQDETCTIADPGGASFGIGAGVFGHQAPTSITAGAGFATIDATTGKGDFGNQVAAGEYMSAEDAGGGFSAGFTHTAEDGCGNFIAVELVP